MTVTLDRPVSTRTRDPKELLNAVQPRIKHLTINVLDGGMTLLGESARFQYDG